MYPRNAASPQRIAIGAVVQISDGAVQTSGVSVKVMPQGGAASAGGGTIAYEEGIVHYVPTQAETNYASFIVIAYKTGCIPVAVTIVTTASGVAGYAGLDWATINAPTTTQVLSGTTVGTITTYTGNTPQTGDSYARIGTNGASLTSLASAANLATVAGYLDTEIADIQARLPAALVGGRMDASVGAMASNVITAAATASDFGAEIADAVWDEAISGHVGAGSTGAALNAAGSAGDPWTTPLPGAYGAGTAGYIIGTNLDTTVGSRSALDAAGVRTAVGLASANLDTQLGDLPTAVENADALLGRNVAGGSSSGRLVKEALYALRNKWTVSGGTYTVYATDDSTPAWTSSVTGTAGADPLTASDPA